MREEWILKVQEKVRQRLGAAYDVDLGNLKRTDGIFMQGLILRKKGAPISLTVEVPAWALSSEETAGKAAELILEFFDKERSLNLGTWNPEDFSTVKHRIARRIISTRENRKLLEEVPHIDFLDWSIVSYLYLTDKEENVWTALIRWEHLRFWDITEQQMWELARNNTPALLPARIRHISEWGEREDRHLKKGVRGTGWDGSVETSGMAGRNGSAETSGIAGRNGSTEQDVLTGQDNLDGRGRREDDSKKALPLFLLSSEQGIYGASCLLYDNLLHRFCEGEGFDSLLILPLSIHEVFLLPEEKMFYADYLKNVIMKGLYKENQREERLTDSIYRYEREKGRLTIC